MTKFLRFSGQVAAVSVLATLAIAAPMSAASAADHTVYTHEELLAALADCTAPSKTITLGADIDAFPASYTVSCDTTLNLLDNSIYAASLLITPGITLDVVGVNGTAWDDTGTLQLNGSTSYSPGIITTGATLRVNSGRVVADAAAGNAAIGGRSASDDSDISGGTLIVAGGEVWASTSHHGYEAAIGGGIRFSNPTNRAGDGGSVAVTGGKLTVTVNSMHGVGIGGGGSNEAGGGGNGANLSVTGGTVEVNTNGANSTAIGGGALVTGEGVPGNGGTLTIGEAGTVNVAAVGSVFGGGWHLDPVARGAFGTLNVNGTMYAGSGNLSIPDTGAQLPEVTIGLTGKLYGGMQNPAIGATISGAGSILNNGVVALDPPSEMVSGNNRLFSFQPAATPVRVFAPSFATGYRTLPTPPAGNAWNTEATGAGTWVVADTAFSGTGNTSLFAAEPGTLAASAAAADLTAHAGEPYIYPVTVYDRDQAPVNPQPEIEYTSDTCDLPDGGVFRTVGECTILASTELYGATLTTEFTVTVIAGAPQSLSLSVPSTHVDQGETLTFGVYGVDAFGNPVDTAGAVLTSNVASDVVDGWSVTFPSASTHRITATLGDIAATVAIEVNPASPTVPSEDTDTSVNGTGTHANDGGKRLSQTGESLNTAWFAGALGGVLLLAGGMVIAARKRASAL